MNPRAEGYNRDEFRLCREHKNIVIMAVEPGRKPSQRRERPSAVSLFSGAGGFCEGVRLANYDVVCAVEADRDACRTHSTNFPEVPLFACQCRRENVSAGRSKTASRRGARCPTGRFLLRAKQDEKRIASPAKVPETSRVASPSVLPSPQLILRLAPAPLLNPQINAY